jgi:leucyl aminopeptidase
MTDSTAPWGVETAIAADSGERAIPVELVAPSELDRWRAGQSAAVRGWLAANQFAAKPHEHCLLPGAGGIDRVVVGLDPTRPLWSCAHLPKTLPAGRYVIANPPEPDVLDRIALGWGLGHYEYTAYKRGADATESAREARVLCLPDPDRVELVRHQLAGVRLTRDLINTPAGDMMPEDLAHATARLAEAFDAEWSEVVGDDLLAARFPAIHAVGRASVHAPRLLDLRWGSPHAPKVTLVGKGVCFDSGGLDIKPASGMRLMKKDMGGAAHALGLARMIMGARLPLRLRVLIPAVENAISGNAYRPGDVVPTRAGLNIEIENTDAEGRVVLSDALAEGGAERPELMIDFATLTGAARVALGTDLPALFCNDDALAGALIEQGLAELDPMWRMPLHAPYKELIESKVGDLMNGSAQPFGGAITAALFLEAFVPEGVAWGHFDIMAWSNRARPGRPEGGEAMVIRGLFAYLRRRYAV